MRLIEFINCDMGYKKFMGEIMKTNIFKRIMFISLIILLISITGCQNDVINRIYTAELTTKEENFITNTDCSRFAVFEIEFEDNFSDMFFWVDRYEFGKKTSNILGMHSDLRNKSSKSFNAMLVMHQLKIEDEKWVISIDSERSNAIIKSYKYDDVLGMWDIVDEVKIVDGEECVLAGLFYQKGNEMVGLPGDFLSNSREYDYETMLKAYDDVYILKARFSK